MVTTQGGGQEGGGGGTSFTPHTVTLTAGHLAAVPGGSDLAQPKRVFLTATVRGNFLPVAAGAGQQEMWSVCRCWAGPGSSPSLASSQCSGDSVFFVYVATQLLYI